MIIKNTMTSYNLNIREEELKNKIAEYYFWIYDNTKIIGNIDFCVSMHKNESLEQESLLWAEAKKGKSDIYKSFVQLILTIGKSRTFDKNLPPSYLGAFDAEKIAFIPYNDIHEIFYLNDFNWNVTPSNHKTKEFKLLYEKVKNILEKNTLIFYYEKDEKELKKFIKNNFVIGKFGITKTQIDKNNFMVIYNKWLENVKLSIAVNWDIAKKKGIIDGDFYLADLLSRENTTLKDKLFVVLKTKKYELNRHQDEYGAFTSSFVNFNDGQKAHNQFWNKYERPPKEEYWDYIIERRDLLVPQDVRERKGSFFTPKIWVEKSQKYLSDVLGEDWQEEYYIWDCAAGTGNLLAGLTNKYNIWASTIDKQDVEVMKDRIKNGANLLESHVFQFDFLNDEFTKLPKPLQKIINDPKKREKLVLYINPPYAEIAGKKTGVNLNKIHDKYANQLKVANRELYAQFLIRIYYEISNCIIGEFSTLKALSGSNFKKFREFFLAELVKCFVVPANTFDNVKGLFPIGFKIWKTYKKIKFKKIQAKVFDNKGEYIGKHTFNSYANSKYFSKWVKSFKEKSDFNIAWMEGVTRNDFQSQNGIIILNVKEQIVVPRGIYITKSNLIKSSICFAVRKSIKATWLNDRDQFIHPNDSWKKDKKFQNDCLTFTLFNNNIQTKFGTNHWIPFTENEVNSREKFESNFMVKFIQGKLKANENGDLLGKKILRRESLEFSSASKEVFNAGRELWIYYHTKPNCNVNASLYDIRSYFQGRSPKGRMNNKSNDKKYMNLITNLRGKLKILAKKIEPKIYEYGFLKK